MWSELSEDTHLDTIIAQTKLSKKQTSKQQKIVETAIKMFAEKGYANTPTSEIAKQAGVAEGTIFRHYGTKDNLLLSVILPFFKESIPDVAEEIFNEIQSENMLSFEDFLRAFLKNRMEFIQNNSEIFRVVVKELFYSEELRKEILPIFSVNIQQHFNKVIDQYKKSGELVNLPNETLQRMLFTLIGGYFISRFVFWPSYSIINEEEEVENIVRFVMDGIRKN